MASVIFVFSVRDGAASPPGVRKTGLTPTWVFLKRLSDLSSVASLPTISEVGQGQYGFAYDPEVNGEAAGQVDAGAALASPADRYIDVLLPADSSQLATIQGRIPGTVQPQTGDAYARIGAAGAGLTALGDARLGADTPGTGTLLARLTGTRANYLDNLNGQVPQTGDAYARIGAAGAGLTALGDTRLAFLDAPVASRMATFTYTAPPADYQQRSVAVTLPANPPAGFLVAASFASALKDANGYLNTNVVDIAGAAAAPATTPDVNVVSLGGLTSILAALVSLLKAQHGGNVTAEVTPSPTQFACSSASLTLPAARYVGSRILWLDPASNATRSNVISNCTQASGYKLFTFQASNPLGVTPAVGDPFLITTSSS